MAARGEQWRHPLLYFIFFSISLKKEKKDFKTGIAMISAMKKMAIILPTGQWYAPSAVIHDACYCMVLYGIALYCIVLHGNAWYCMVLHGFAW